MFNPIKQKYYKAYTSHICTNTIQIQYYKLSKLYWISVNFPFNMIKLLPKHFKFLLSKLKYSESITANAGKEVKDLQATNKTDTIFIRHAHSEFNKACQYYRKKHNIDYNWELLCQHPGFQSSVAYNPDYFDCSLTEKGLEQCYLTGHKINIKDVDVILVSPHQRTLETCANIFKFSKSKFNVPVIVQPLVAGSLWSSCDISCNIEQKKKQFPFFNFKKMLNQPELWFIENLQQKDKLKIYSQISRMKITDFNQKQFLILDMLKSKLIHEDPRILRQRAWQIKKMMQKIKEKHYKILIISHYYIIQYVNAKSFNQQSHTPTEDLDLKNCYPYYSTMNQLLNNSK